MSAGRVNETAGIRQPRDGRHAASAGNESDSDERRSKVLHDYSPVMESVEHAGTLDSYDSVASNLFQVSGLV